MPQSLLLILIHKEGLEPVSVAKFITYERIEEDKQDFGQHHKQKKKEYYRKVLAELIEDLEGRTYLEKDKDSTIWEEV